MLEFNKSEKNLHEVAQLIWDDEVLFWKDLSVDHKVLQCGFVDKRPNYGMVHDPNALNLNELTSHAGLFGTIDGVCKTLINFNQKLDLLKHMNSELSDDHERFVLGWDTVTNPNNTLAGNGCGERVFGHLGFTGTSIWIDPVKKLGHVLLTNATKVHWFDKTELNKLRKSLGEFIWEKS
ncbi:MAG: serine hydrolase, partial [Bacteriovoracaceae bacterium]|nr:serine hydrolase [Bacteriovoracaceae bacterium]